MSQKNLWFGGVACLVTPLLAPTPRWGNPGHMLVLLGPHAWFQKDGLNMVCHQH